MKKQLNGFQFLQIGNDLYITKNNKYYMVITDVDSKDLGKAVSLFAKMVELEIQHNTISFEGMKRRYSMNNRFNFSKIEKQTYSIDRWNNQRPAC